MKAVLVILILMPLCLVSALPSWAADKAGARSAAISNTPSASDTAAPKAAKPADSGAPSANETAPSGTKALKPAPEGPDGRHIAVKGDLLSVNVKDQPFGEVIASIANAAGFDVEISNDVFGMTLSTMFKDIDLQRGIVRLLSLINQKNYFIHYKPNGSIKIIEIYGNLSSGQRTLTGSRPATAATKPAEAPAPARAATPPAPKRSQTRTPPPTPPAMVVPSRKRMRLPQPQPAESPGTTAPEEPVKEEDILELEYKFFTPRSGAETETPEPQETTPAETPAETPAPADTSAPPASTTPASSAPSEYVEEEIIPEGDLPPESSLLNAPVMLPSGSPAPL